MLQLGALLFATAAHVGARPDACQILTKKEISAVQGEAYNDTKLTPRNGGSQCFYQLPTFTKSVSVDVIRGSGKELTGAGSFHVKSSRPQVLRKTLEVLRQRAGNAGKRHNVVLEHNTLDASS